MSRETFRRELGQLLWVGFEEPRVNGELARELKSGMWGGAILFARNLVYRDDVLSTDELRDLTDGLRTSVSSGEAPLFVAVDQEGGRVQRARNPVTRWPAMLAHDKLGNEGEATARDVGHAIGRELDALDFDIDFAPVLDVNSNPDNPIIGDRSFSGDAKRAAKLALSFADGLAAAGIVGCGKHYPGHGDTTTDSHLELPRVDRDREGLEAIELYPFRRAAAAKLPMLMTAHVVFSALDSELPATLSPKIVGDLLRRDIGYAGLVVSDDIDMKAIADHWGVAEAAERSILAGCDVLLLCRDRDHQRLAYEGLIRAAESSSLLRDRIRESAKRIHHAKRDHFRRRVQRTRPGLEVLGCVEHHALATKLRSALERDQG